jgi:hypothetical protein
MASKALKAVTVEQALDELDRRVDHANLAAAMTAAFAEIEGATKAATNPHFKSKYADLTSIIEAIKPPLIRHGLFFTQRCHPDQEGVSVETVLHHSSGEKESLGTLFVPANKRDAQGFGSALTYARRYALQTAFGVPTEDDDGNAAVATARPTTGEAPPRKRVTLDGPYDTVPKLERAAREFARTLRSMSSVEEFENWKQDEEVKAFVEQCKRDLPGWWFANHPDCPPDFIPLAVEVANTKRGLAELEEINARNPA